MLKIYNDFINQISPDFSYDKLEKRISKFKDKYLEEIKEIPFGDTDKLLTVLMEIELKNASDFVKQFNSVFKENDFEIKNRQIKHFERLTINS